MIRVGRLLARLGCIRRGHALYCTALGHVCVRCGAAWEVLP